MKKLVYLLLSFGLVGTLATPHVSFAQDEDEDAAKTDSSTKTKTKKKKRKKSMSSESSSGPRLYGMAGCGLGNLAFGKDSQILAATTNGTASNQYFGITSGTSNCVDSATSAAAERLDQFTIGNKVALAGDISRGQGETIQTVSKILGCENSSVLGKHLQSNFQKIYPNEHVNFMQVTDSLLSVVLDNQDLRVTCTKVNVI